MNKGIQDVCILLGILIATDLFATKRERIEGNKGVDAYDVV